ncbi:hypothetical protein Bpfe_009800, partial [Biomphalaria pfeifferi]
MPPESINAFCTNIVPDHLPCHYRNSHRLLYLIQTCNTQRGMAVLAFGHIG